MAQKPKVKPLNEGQTKGNKKPETTSQTRAAPPPPPKKRKVKPVNPDTILGLTLHYLIAVRLLFRDQHH